MVVDVVEDFVVLVTMSGLAGGHEPNSKDGGEGQAVSKELCPHDRRALDNKCELATYWWVCTK